MSDISDSEPEEEIYTEVVNKNFAKATEQVKRISSTLSQKNLLEFYGLYKQAEIGNCNIPKPSIFNMEGRAKWDAWNELRDVDREDAKVLYVEKLTLYEISCDLSCSIKPKKQIGWVVHSIEMAPTDLKPEHEKNSFDHVKEGNLERLQESLVVTEIHQLDEHGMGLIHWATDRNAVEILQFLITVGADVNFRDGEQQTALHYAASCGHIDCMNVLLQSNANRFITDDQGKTCIDVAENLEIRMLLLNIS